MNTNKARSMRFVIGVSIFVLFFMILSLGWAFENGQAEKTVSGTVTDIDWVNSTISVRCFDEYSGDSNEIEIIVPEGTRIVNGTETKSLSDILQSDPVTVIYYDDGLNGLKAKSITDRNEGSRF